MEVNYADLENEIIDMLEKEQNIVFATCANNHVSARTMCHVNDGLNIMFSTGGDSGKVEQVKQNPNVALVVGPLQIEAMAELNGPPSKNKRFLDINDAKYPWMKDAFPREEGAQDTGMLVICHPTKISIYKYLDGQPHWDVLIVKDQKAIRL